MNSYPFDRTLSSESDVLDYYTDVIRYRNSHKDQYQEIAIHAFDRTHPSRLPLPWNKTLDDLRFELIALEGPGMPEDDKNDPDEYMDELWQRLLNLVEDAKKKRTF
jgi:hypothetical protein